jgi:hypothetical protein
MRRVYSLLFALGFLMWAGLSYAQVPLQVTFRPVVIDGTKVVIMDTLSSAGRTVCDDKDKPEIWIHRKFFGSIGFSAILVHEQEHVKQAGAVGSCQLFLSRYQQDSIFRFTSEVDAFAAQTAYEVRSGFISTEHREDAVVGLLLLYYNPPFRAEEVVRRVRSSRR